MILLAISRAQGSLTFPTNFVLFAAMNPCVRGYHRVLKLARTIADLAGSEPILAPHLAEALQYRPKVLS
jgi:predicted ATPase with chaperone activity